MRTNVGKETLRSCLIFIILLFIVTGCAMTPSTTIHQPASLRPNAQITSENPTGSIFQQTINSGLSGSRYIPLFEDRRARNVGDTIIVTLNEKTNAFPYGTDYNYFGGGRG